MLDMKMIVYIADHDAVENNHQSVIKPVTGLFRLEGILGVLWDKKNPHNILPTYLFAKALVPSKLKFLPVVHALTVYDTTSFSAGHGIAKILNRDFGQFFFSHGKEVLLFIETMKQNMRVTVFCFCGRAAESARHLHSFVFLSQDWRELISKRHVRGKKH